MRSMFALFLLGSGVAFAGDVPARVSSLFDKVRSVGSGEVCFSYTARPGVYGNGRSINVDDDFVGEFHAGDGPFNGDWHRDGWESGPVRVLMEVSDNDIADLEVWVGNSRRIPKGAHDLGSIPPGEAAAFLLSIAKNARHEEVAAEAIFPATLAEGVEPWPALFDLARDKQRPGEVRRNALFWLGQAAGREITAKLGAVIDDSLEDVDLRKHAVFVLSQRPEEESVPRLLEIARTHKSADVREAALFWLAQGDDPRVLDLLEEILLEG